jgi:Glycosyl transferase family 2
VSDRAPTHPSVISPGTAGATSPKFRPDALVSAIITTYNYARFLPDAIESVLAQSCDGMEIVVVDDGSTDETARVAARYADRGVRYVRRPHGGAGRARNAGLEVTSAPLVAFLDADDAWLPDRVAAGLDHLARHPELALAAAHAYACDEQLRPTAIVPAATRPAGHMLDALLVDNVVLNPSSVLIRRSAIEAAGGFSEIAFGEDWDTWIEIAKRFPIGFIDRPLALVRRHAGSVSPRRGPVLVAAHRAIVEPHLREYAPAWKRPVLRRRAASMAYFHAALGSVKGGERRVARRYAITSLALDPVTLARRKAKLVARAFAPDAVVGWVRALVVLALTLAGCGGQARPPTVHAQLAASPTSRPPLFVAPDGRDSNPGTMRRPFRTLAHGLSRVRAGGSLYVRGGTYAERIKVHAAPGRPTARVLVSNFPGERPLLRGQLWIGEPSYWTIRGIDVTWAAGNPDEPMVRIYGGTGWTLTGAEIWGAHATSGLHVDDGPRADLGTWRVAGNCIHDTYPTNGQNQDHNIYVDDMSTSPNPRGVITRNVLFDAVNGRGIKLGPGGATGGAVNVDVSYNTIYNSAQNIGVSRDSSRVRIYRNLLDRASEANVFSFELKGEGNAVRDNVGADAPRFLANTGSPRPLVDGGGNLFPAAPYFDSIGCRGFHPALLGSYGAYG